MSWQIAYTDRGAPYLIDYNGNLIVKPLDRIHEREIISAILDGQKALEEKENLEFSPEELSAQLEDIEQEKLELEGRLEDLIAAVRTFVFVVDQAKRIPKSVIKALEILIDQEADIRG